MCFPLVILSGGGYEGFQHQAEPVQFPAEIKYLEETGDEFNTEFISNVPVYLSCVLEYQGTRVQCYVSAA